MSTLFRTLFIAIMVGWWSVGQIEAAPLATNAPPRIELRDQYDRPQELSFPTTNVTLLAIADRKGSDQIASWIAAVKPRYSGKIAIRGLADLGGAPWFVQGRIRKYFQETCAYPVMMDWSGTNCARFNYRPGKANILILDPAGKIRGWFFAAADERQLREAFSLIDQLLKPAD